jgi:hypothetical protein
MRLGNSYDHSEFVADCHRHGGGLITDWAAGADFVAERKPFSMLRIGATTNLFKMKSIAHDPALVGFGNAISRMYVMASLIRAFNLCRGDRATTFKADCPSSATVP